MALLKEILLFAVVVSPFFLVIRITSLIRKGWVKGLIILLNLELSDYKMIKAMEWGCRPLQIFGDSMIIINLENGIQRCHIIRLLPFLENIFSFKQHLHSLSITHVYRDRNRMDETLSKEEAPL